MYIHALKISKGEFKMNENVESLNMETNENPIVNDFEASEFSDDFFETKEMDELPLEQWHTDSFSCKEELCVMEVQNATILPLKHFDSDDVSQGRGGVVDSVDGYIGLSGVEGRIFGRYEYDINSCDYIDSEIVYGGYLTNHWGHFLIESVPRLWYALTHP